jgi:hypothetical protein
MEISVDFRCSLLQGERTTKKLELLLSQTKRHVPACCAQTHVQFVICGMSMKMGFMSLCESRERERVKHERHQRKVVWDCVSALVPAGFSAQAAIDRVCDVCGLNASASQESSIN